VFLGTLESFTADARAREWLEHEVEVYGDSILRMLCGGFVA
jgi:hypothetical protein